MRLATTWQKRTSASLKLGPSRKVRRKMAPMGVPRHVMGTTVMLLTRRCVRAPRTWRRVGSLTASGMNTVCPEWMARLSSGYRSRSTS